MIGRDSNPTLDVAINRHGMSCSGRFGGVGMIHGLRRSDLVLMAILVLDELRALR